MASLKRIAFSSRLTRSLHSRKTLTLAQFERGNLINLNNRCSPSSLEHNIRFISLTTAFRNQSHDTFSTAKKTYNHLSDEYVSPKPHVDEVLSYAYGRSLKELKYCTLAPLIDERSLKEPQSTAVIVYDEGISKSFEDLNADINRLANGMVLNLGLKRGDKVALYSYNNYQFVVIQLACHKLGLVFNPINPSYKSHEFSFVMSKADANVLFMPGKKSRQVELNDHYAIFCNESLPKLRQEGKINYLTDLIILDGEFDEKDLQGGIPNVRRWRDTLVDSPSLKPEVEKMVDEVRADDIYGVYYTSGTTGFPKGATISQYTVINNASLSCERLFKQRGPNFYPIRPNVCIPLPLFHEFAGVLGILLPFTFGGSILFPGLRYSITSVVEAILRFKCNVLFLTPTILIDLMTYVDGNGLNEKVPLKSILIAGSPVMPELIHKVHRCLPNLEEIRIAYGSSENGVISTLQTGDEPLDSKAITVGPPLDFTEIRVADTATGATTRLGETGEIQTRGFNTMVSYYNDPVKTSEVITSSRWYKTGDLGTIDKEGRLRISGRSKDLIIKGGENIYPGEVETILHKIDIIEDAHVFGVPDKRYGEEVCTWVKLAKSKCGNHTENELKESIIKQCKETLTYFKVPKYVIFVEEFPLTPVKKVKKFEMRAQTVKLLGLE